MLQEAICSALNQRFCSFEVLVVDDGSDSPTIDWLHAIERDWPQLRIVYRPNQGVAVARQNGLRAARGKLVCILDSDDSLVPHALERIVTAFKRDPDADLVYCNYRSWTGSQCRTILLPRYSNNEEMLRGTFSRPRVPFKHSGTTFRREVALDLGGYDVTLPAKVDVDLFLKFLATDRRLVLLDEPLVEFRFHPESISRKRWMGLQIWFKLIDRYGPACSFKRIGYKTVRFTAETGKSLYEKVRFCLTQGGNSSRATIMVEGVRK